MLRSSLGTRGAACGSHFVTCSEYIPAPAPHERTRGRRIGCAAAGPRLGPCLITKIKHPLWWVFYFGCGARIGLAASATAACSVQAPARGLVLPNLLLLRKSPGSRVCVRTSVTVLWQLGLELLASPNRSILVPATPSSPS